MIMANRGTRSSIAPTAFWSMYEPPRLESRQKQIPAHEVERTRRIAELRIHTECVTGRGQRINCLDKKISTLCMIYL